MAKKRIKKKKKARIHQEPVRKISETLLDFAEPYLRRMGHEDISPTEFKTILHLPLTVWNAMVVESWGEKTGMLAEARAMIAQDGLEKILDEFDLLVKRRNEFFADDPRAIEEISVTRDPQGELVVRAQARGPEQVGEEGLGF
jgi:hypothetical protein